MQASGEGNRVGLDELLLECVDEKLVVSAVLILGHEGVHSALEGLCKEVPRGARVERLHAEEGGGPSLVVEDFDRHRGKETLGLLSDEASLREAHDANVCAIFVQASVTSVRLRHPGDVCNDTLRVRRLRPEVRQLVVVLAEGSLGSLGEVLVVAAPHVVLHRVISDDLVPKELEFLRGRTSLPGIASEETELVGSSFAALSANRSLNLCVDVGIDLRVEGFLTLKLIFVSDSQDLRAPTNICLI